VKTNLKEYLKVMISLTPSSQIFRMKMRRYTHLLNCSTVIYFGDFGDTGLELIAEQVLSENIERRYDESVKTQRALRLKNHQSGLKVMVRIYKSVKNMTIRLY
jgi:hypothetical protein